MKRILLVILLLCGITSAVSAQQKITLKGHVEDSNGEPLIGAGVIVKGKIGMGAVTNYDGDFYLEMEPYNRIEASFLGCKTVEVLIKEEEFVSIVLEPETNLVIDEVVVTASGSQRKLTQTGAVTPVSVDALKTSVTGSLTNSLAGNAPGIIARQTSGQPGYNNSEFWIRGISTFGAGSSALVLVDGFERDINQLNVEDIESFSVLKDASETAIYGSRGANGVVLITTKRGKEGKINIDVKIEGVYNTRTYTPEFVDGYTYANMANEARITRNEKAYYTAAELRTIADGSDPDRLPNVDWMDKLMKKGAFNGRAAINIDGGGEKVRYYISASYLNEGGMYKVDDELKSKYSTNANNEKWNYRMNADVNITPTTLLQMGVGGMYQKLDESGSTSSEIWNSVIRQNPVSVPAVYSNGLFPATKIDENNYFVNPWVRSTQTGYTQQWWNRIQTNFTLNQDLDFITKGLKFVGRFGYDTNSYSQIRRYKMPELYQAKRVRELDGSLVYEHVANPVEMTQTSYSTGDRKVNLEAELRYDRIFNNAHNVSGLLKYLQDSCTESTSVDGSDMKKVLAKRHMGVVGRAAYNWKYRYFINFNFGYTGSENFATGKKFGFFPAVSVAWNLAEEPWIQKAMPWMSMTKFRYSWGRVGNDQLMDSYGNALRFPYMYTMGELNGYYWSDHKMSNAYEGNGLGFVGVAPVPGVTWEIAVKHDVGVDLAWFQDKFTLTLDWFHETRSGIFLQRKYLPGSVGVDTEVYGNVGKSLSTGFDGNFAYKQMLGPVQMTIRGNITYSYNEVLEKDDEYSAYPYQMEKGYRINQAKGLIALGLFKDYDDIRQSPKQTFGTYQPGDIKYKDVNGDGVIDEGDYVAIGATTVPSLIYGAGIAFNWKGLELNLHFQGAGKSSFFINGPSVYAFSNGAQGNILKAIAESDRWIDESISGTSATMNPDAEYPRLSFGGNENNYRPSTFWLRDGSYLRLKTLELAYTLPKKYSNAAKMSDVRFFLMGSNLLTFSKFKLWDPELGSSDGAAYPLSKSVTLGVNIKF